MQIKFNGQKGFTLVEILIAVVIMAILSTIAIIGYTKVTQGMRDRLARTRLAVFAEAQSRFKLGMGRGRYAGACELARTTSNTGELLIPETVARFDGNCTPIPLGDWYISDDIANQINNPTLKNRFIIRLTKGDPLGGRSTDVYCIAEDGVLRRGISSGRNGGCDRNSPSVE